VALLQPLANGPVHADVLNQFLGFQSRISSSSFRKHAHRTLAASFSGELQILRNDPRWLARVSDAIVNYWLKKYSNRRVNDEKQFSVAG
jgi:hypothetical protein